MKREARAGDRPQRQRDHADDHGQQERDQHQQRHDGRHGADIGVLVVAVRDFDVLGEFRLVGGELIFEGGKPCRLLGVFRLGGLRALRCGQQGAVFRLGGSLLGFRIGYESRAVGDSAVERRQIGFRICEVVEQLILVERLPFQDVDCVLAVADLLRFLLLDVIEPVVADLLQQELLPVLASQVDEGIEFLLLRDE